ncbi:MAG: ATP-binding protein, partial [Rhodovibrionaceae bacterium]
MTIVLVLIFGIAASVYGGREIGKQADAERMERAQHQAVRVTTELDRALSQTEATLRALAAIFYSSDEVTEGELMEAERISQGESSEYSFASLAFAVRVLRRERESFEKAAGQNLTALDRRPVTIDSYESFPIVLATDDGILARHVDLSSSDATRAAVATAYRLPGKVIMGPAFSLDGIWWSVMAVSAPNNYEDGVLVGLLNVSELFAGITGNIPQGLELQLHQNETAWDSIDIEHLILGKETTTENVESEFSLRINHGQAHWELKWSVLPTFEVGPRTQLARVLILGGSLLSLTVALLLAVLLAQNLRIRSRVKQRTEELARARDEAETANRTKTEFLANMSHELRTPLNAILGFSEIIRDQVFGPDARERYREYAQDIHRSGAHLLEIITDILDIAKAEEGKLDLAEDNFDLQRLMDGVRQLMRERALAEGVTLELDTGSGVPALFADGRRIKQILINLLSNAIKFTPEGGRVALISRLRKDGGVRIEVTDTGIGMAESDIPTALKPFGQVDSALSRKFDGTGLGLPISRHLAELHGANLSVKSELGKGTTVTLDFPASRSVR